MKLFVSYARLDASLVIALADRLRQEYHHEVWFDSSIPAGVEWWGEILSQIETCDCFIAIMTESFNASIYCQDELAYGVALGKPLLPLNLTTVTLPKIKPIQYIQVEGSSIDEVLLACLRGLSDITQHKARHVMPILKVLIKRKRPVRPPMPKSEIVNAQDFFQVRHIVPEYLFIGNNALSMTDLQCIYESEAPELPANLIETKRRYIDTRLESARENGVTLDDNLTYGLRSVSVARPQDSLGIRRNVYTLHVYPSSYFSFVFPNSALDAIFVIDGKRTTLRQEIGLEHGNVRIENLSQFPIHSLVGTGTIFITADSKIVLSLRSSHQYVVGGLNYHLSTAEGMLRPVDARMGEVSPFWTSVRSLQDELGLRPGVDFLTESIRCLGIVFDTLRCQPNCFFYVKSQQIMFEDLKKRWLYEAVDKHENSDIIGLDWNKETARRIMTNNIIYQGTPVSASSNHAESGFKIAARHEFGADFL